MSLPLRMPAEIERALVGRSWSAVDVGMSSADVFHFERGLYLKTVRRVERDRAFGNLAHERAKLEWLAGKLPVPAVVAFARDESRDYLVLTEVQGRHAAAEAPAPEAAPRLVEALAAACRSFHGLSPLDCPFDGSVDSLVREAERRVELGLVDSDNFDAEHVGREPAELFRELQGLRPEHEDLVVVHGDLCLPNIILEGDKLSGFIDVGRVGVSDRWRDLALCARSIEHNWGPPWAGAFLDAYGASPDPGKRAFYLLLEEFF